MRNLLCHLHWLPDYAGTDADIDWIRAHPEERHRGDRDEVGELLNFLPKGGRNLGYVRADGRINTLRLGAAKKGGSAHGVRVIWTAAKPDGARVVVGWYEDATVQPIAQKPKRKRSWRIECAEGQAHLVPQDARTFIVPDMQSGKGRPGRKPHFFIDEYPETMSQWLSDFDAAYPVASVPDPATHRNGWPIQPDAAHNALVEAAAVAAVIRLLGPRHESREKDNRGWDLEFERDGRRLCVEVKGVSAPTPQAQVTPNEYAAIRRAMSGGFVEGDYRLAVVTSALTAPEVHLYAHAEGQLWRCERHSGCVLGHREIVAASFDPPPP